MAVSTLKDLAVHGFSWMTHIQIFSMVRCFKMMKLSSPELDYIDVSLKYTTADDSWYAGVYDEMLNSDPSIKQITLQIQLAGFAKFGNHNDPKIWVLVLVLISKFN